MLIKDTITPRTGVIAWWCMSCILEGLIMVPNCRFQLWATKVVLATYLFSCQLSGLCLDYSVTLVVFSCGVMVISY